MSRDVWARPANSVSGSASGPPFGRTAPPPRHALVRTGPTAPGKVRAYAVVRISKRASEEMPR